MTGRNRRFAGGGVAVVLTVSLVLIATVAAPVAAAAPSASAEPAGDASVDASGERCSTGGDGAALSTARADANASVALRRVEPGFDAANASGDAILANSSAFEGDGPPSFTTRTDLAAVVSVDGLDAAVAAESGTETERVLRGLDALGSFELRTGPCYGADPYWLNATNVHARLAPGEDTVVVVVDLDSVAAVSERTHGNGPFIEQLRENGSVAADVEELWDDFPEYGVVSFDPSTERFGETEPYRERFRVDEPEAWVSTPPSSADRPWPLRPAANATIVGRTTALPGSTVVVTASADGYDATRRVPVAADGGFAATFDLRDVDPPADLEVVVRVDRGDGSADLELARTALSVTEPAAVVQARNGSTEYGVVAATATLSHGGVLALRAPDGTIVETSDPIPPGVERDVSIPVYEDRNGTYALVAYHVTADGLGDRYADASATATVSLEPADATTTTVTFTGPLTTTTEPAPTLVGSDRDPSTSPIPGFDASGVLAALAVLAGIAVVARKRRGG